VPQQKTTPKAKSRLLPEYRPGAARLSHPLVPGEKGLSETCKPLRARAAQLSDDAVFGQQWSAII
jgi:hypothetical protein